jgi:hypothetical protein
VVDEVGVTCIDFMIMADYRRPQYNLSHTAWNGETVGTSNIYIYIYMVVKKKYYNYYRADWRYRKFWMVCGGVMVEARKHISGPDECDGFFRFIYIFFQRYRRLSYIYMYIRCYRVTTAV